MQRQLLILFILISINSYAQDRFDSTKISKNLMQVVYKIVACKCTYYSENIFAENRNTIPSISEEFRKGTVQEFLELINHPSKEVRYLAFNEVASRVDTFSFMPYILKSFKSSEEISSERRCIVNGMNFTDYLIKLFLPKMTFDQKQTMDSIIIFNVVDGFYAECRKLDFHIRVYAKAGPINYRDKLIYNLIPEEKYYTRLKYLYSLEDNPLILYSILKYAKTEDTTLFIDGLSSYRMEYLFNQSSRFWCFRSIYERPKPFYKSTLIQSYDLIQQHYVNQEIIERYTFILALSKYECKESIEIMTKLLDDDIKIEFPKNRQLLYLALHDTTDKYFKPIIDKIQISEDDKIWMNNFIYIYNTTVNKLVSELQ